MAANKVNFKTFLTRQKNSKEYYKRPKIIDLDLVYSADSCILIEKKLYKGVTMPDKSAANKKELESKIVSVYMKHVLEHNEKPDSVYQFVKDKEFSEPDFYSVFGTFEALEHAIFTLFFHTTTDLLKKNKEYNDFDAKSRLLAFYFTFFENLKANRSYVLFSLEKAGCEMNKAKLLAGLKKHFKAFVDELDIDTVNLRQERLEEIKQKGLTEIAWQQMLLILNFWVKDTSANFEKTDIFIEKAIKASFDLIDTRPLKSIFDLGKFLFKEQRKSY